MVDPGTRIGTHVDRGCPPLGCARPWCIAQLAEPGALDPLKIETQHHAYVEQRLIAHRSAGEQVLDRLLVTVGGIGKLGLRDLFLDHCRFDERHRAGRLSIRAHARLPRPTAFAAKRIGCWARLSSAKLAAIAVSAARPTTA